MSFLLVPPFFLFWRSAGNPKVFGHEGILEFVHLLCVFDLFSLDLGYQILNIRHNVLPVLLTERILEALTTFSLSRCTRNFRSTLQLRRYFPRDTILIELYFHSFSVWASLSDLALGHVWLLKLPRHILGSSTYIIVVNVLLSGIDDGVSCLLMHSCSLR